MNYSLFLYTLRFNAIGLLNYKDVKNTKWKVHKLNSPNILYIELLMDISPVKFSTKVKYKITACKSMSDQQESIICKEGELKRKTIH